MVRPCPLYLQETSLSHHFADLVRELVQGLLIRATHAHTPQLQEEEQSNASEREKEKEKEKESG